jgi:cell division cycle 14
MDIEQNITGKLSFAFLSHKKSGEDEFGEKFYLNVEDIFNILYIPFKYDFGPPSLGTIYLFSKVMTLRLQKQEYKHVCFYAYNGDKKMITNSICLIGAYCILRLNWSIEKIKTFFKPFEKFCIPYRDASQYVVDTYKLGIFDCFMGMYRAKELGWINLDTFNYYEYSHYERIENGDFNWIIPNKFLASASPSVELRETEDSMSLPTSHYIKYFQSNNVSTVVRLNNIDYDRNDFLKEGIDHKELFFPDGTSPTIEIVHEFLKISEDAAGAIAVHCKQGLGRTGTLIACYLVKHFQFSVPESIAYIRLCRPGSVVGQQQHFLEAIEPILISLRIEDPVIPPQSQIRHSNRLANKASRPETPKEIQRRLRLDRNVSSKDMKPLSNKLKEKKNITKPVDINTKKRKIADFIQPKIKRVRISTEGGYSEIIIEEHEMSSEINDNDISENIKQKDTNKRQQKKLVLPPRQSKKEERQTFIVKEKKLSLEKSSKIVPRREPFNRRK